MSYWDTRYESGRGSGKGSRGRYAQLKAALVNRQLVRHQIASVLDIGCGDGYVASLLHAEGYLGVDPSPVAVALSQQRNPGRRFDLFTGTEDSREAHLSLDILHHLVDDTDYAAHMRLLFSADRIVLVWVADFADGAVAAHSRHRRWQLDVPEPWTLTEETPIDGAPVSFYLFTR